MAKFWQVYGGKAHAFLGEMTPDELAARYCTDPTKPYHINVVDTTDLSEQPEEGWTYADGVFTAPAGPTPEEAAAAKKNAIKAKRDEMEAATPFVYAGSSFDYDGLSRERINAAVSASVIAALGGTDTATVVATWTLYDNTTRDMTIADWLAFRQAEVVRSGGYHETARMLKAAVDAALANGATAEEIDALPIWEVP